MSSSNSKSDRPRIPGRCDICEHKDGRMNMTLLQCSKCKVCVHKECYMVYPEDDDDFVCYACAAVGRTYQAVDTHMSNRFHEIEQKERPVECALCSVTDGVHAMNPLFDYHGTGGRQICSKSKNGEKKLIWAHALCALYLAANGFLYACYKDGDYQGIEDDDESDTDPRPPNPECKLTKEFVRKYGTNAMPHFRYYMAPPNGELDPWTKAVQIQQTELKCIECGLADNTKKSMRIPVQCVANDNDEFDIFQKRRRARRNGDDTEPCTQALHVGCARWGNPSSKLRQCFYMHGDNNRSQNVLCIYCKKHAEDVNEKHEKIEKKPIVSLTERKRALEKDRRGEIQQHNIRPKKAIEQVPRTVKDHRPDTSGKVSLDAIPKASRIQGNDRDKKSQPYKEPDRMGAVAINAGKQPTLAKRRRQIEEDPNAIFEHLDEIMSIRKRVKARKRFQKLQNKPLSTDNTEPSVSTTEIVALALSKAPDSGREKSSRTESKDAKPSDNGSNKDNKSGDINMNALDSDEAGKSDGSVNERDLKKKQRRKQTRQLYTDRWSNLFIGLRFEMGNEFTIEKISDKI